MEQDKRAAATLRLLKIMDELREKCPWDRKQTFETLRGNTIEETYELADAILDRNMVVGSYAGAHQHALVAVDGVKG